MREHVTRFSDSSLYDEVCVNCGATDNMGNLGKPSDLRGSCPSPGKPYKSTKEFWNKLDKKNK